MDRPEDNGPSEALRAILKNLKVLYVEDERVTRLLVTRILTSYVKELHVAEDGRQGLFAFARYDPDIVITDIMMPKMDGMGLVQAIRESKPAMPVIVTTCLDDPSTLKKAIELRVQDYVFKPMDTQVLLESLGQCGVSIAREKELEEQKRLNDLMLNSLPHPAALVDVESEVMVLTNSRARELGLCMGGRCGPPFFEEGVFAPGAWGDVIALRGSVPDVHREVRAFNQTWDVSVLPVGARTVLVSAVDITYRKKIENALRQAEKTYRNIFENALEGIFQALPGGPVIKTNPAMAKMLGFANPDDLMREIRNIDTDFFTDRDQQANFARILAEQGEVDGFELEAKRKDGRRIWISLSARAVRDEEGVLQHMEGLAHDVTDRKVCELDLRQKATIDDLTGVPNRMLFLDRFEQTLAHARRVQAKLGVLYIDLDYFKQVNDTHGHHIGDLLLKEAASRMRQRVRESDTLARLGGDEFAILLFNVTKSSAVENVAHKIVDALSRPYILDGIRCVVSASIGICLFPEDGDTSAGLLRNADAAMYKAKAKGRSGWHVYDGSCDFMAQQEN